MGFIPVIAGPPGPAPAVPAPPPANTAWFSQETKTLITTVSVAAVSAIAIHYIPKAYNQYYFQYYAGQFSSMKTPSTLEEAYAFIMKPALSNYTRLNPYNWSEWETRFTDLSTYFNQSNRSVLIPKLNAASKLMHRAFTTSEGKQAFRIFRCVGRQLGFPLLPKWFEQATSQESAMKLLWCINIDIEDSCELQKTEKMFIEQLSWIGKETIKNLEWAIDWGCHIWKLI